jgi:hypothetical protein
MHLNLVLGLFDNNIYLMLKICEWDKKNAFGQILISELTRGPEVL